MEQINPLEQFKIHKVVDINLLGIDISLTNSAILMLTAAIAATIYLLITVRNKKIIPSRLQMSGELLHQTINDMVSQTIGPNGHKFVPMVFTLFLFILLCNLFGMLPYGFTVTSHISVTIILAAIIFLTITVIGFYIHGIKFLSIFLPSGTPVWMAPLMIIIELFAFLAKPLSLSLRLTANMVAGHILLKVITGFILSLTLVWKFLPVPIIIVLIGFEIFIAILQAYIFALLSCAYLNDAVNLPH